METNKSLINEIEVNTVLTGPYAGEKITKDIYGSYHIGDILLTKDLFRKIEKLNKRNTMTSKSSKSLARAKILFGTLIVPGALPFYANSVKKDLENAVMFARITWKNGETSDVFMQEVVYKALTGTSDVFDLPQDIASHIHDVGKTEIDKLRMTNSRKLTAKEYNSDGFNLPSIIKIVDSPARSGNQFLQGAIGWLQKIENLETMSIYSAFVKSSGISFYPTPQSNEIYYRHPHNPTQYIRVDDLFVEAQKSRVAELFQVASKLGATYFRVELVDSNVIKTNKENKASNEANVVVVKAGSSSLHTADSYNETGHTIINESHFAKKRKPTVPTLTWFANDLSINNLIETCMSEGGNPLKSQSINIKCSNYSVMNSETAGSIEAVIKKFGGKTKANLKKHVEEERNQSLIFYIEF